MKTLPVTIPDKRPPARALATFQFLHNLYQPPWHQYETELIELIMAERNQVPPTQQTLDFNDDLPF